MNVTDAITITELSRLLQKSRPTIYKYVVDFEEGNLDAIPYNVKELFRRIEEEDLSHDEILEYCHIRFGAGDSTLSIEAKKAIDFIKDNQDRLDFERLHKLMRKALK